MAEWNGVRMIPHPCSLSTKIWSDMSASFGCGAVCPSLSRWKQLQWTRGLETMRVGEGDNITWMELLPIVLASALWGPAWRGQRIIVHCDNTGTVAVANSGYSRALRIMHLL